MGLASIHQRLYQASDLTAVQCHELIAELANNLVKSIPGSESEIRLSVDAEPVELGPDKAIPLALFATETVMNALKHGASGVDGGWLEISLRRGPDDKLVLSVVNLKAASDKPQDALNTSVGGQLIRAFTNQLSGQLTIDESEGEYRVTLKFENTDDDLSGRSGDASGPLS